MKAVKPPVKADEARKVRLFLDSLQKTERALTTLPRRDPGQCSGEGAQALAEAGAAGAAARAYAVSLDITQCGGYSSG